MFIGASLLVLLSLFGLGTSCGDEKSKVKSFSVKCDTSVDVDPTNANGVNPVDIYVCANSPVTWKAAKGVHFTVFFKNHKCPFHGGCRDINQDSPTSGRMNDVGTTLTVFDYGISIEGDVFDPHVVGGGGAAQQ